MPAFVVVAFLMTYRSLGRIDSQVVGDSGDSLLVLWILGWVQHAIPHGWEAVWNTSMFYPVKDTLAYSESMLSVALVDWPLRAVFGPALGLNLLALAAQTATLWFTYRLALALTRAWMPSVVAALIFGFSTPLLSQQSHYQLLLTAFLVPLTLLLLVRYLERFQLRYGIGIGLAFGALATSSTYYGLMTACGVAVIVAGYLVLFRPRDLWCLVRGLLAGAAVALVIAVPVAIQYLQLQGDPYFHRGFEADVAAHLGDFLAPSDASYLLTEIPPFKEHRVGRTIENRLMPGIAAVGFGIVGIVVVVQAARSRSDDAPADATDADGDDSVDLPRVDERWRARMTLLIASAGLASVVLAFGDEIDVFGHGVPLPFKVFRKIVPGFSGIRATSRFVLLGECALALLAAFGVRQVTRRLTRRAAVVAVAAVCAFVLAETAQSITYVRVPDGPAAEAVGDLLAHRPGGVVVELPIRGAGDGVTWAFTESPRQFVSLVHANNRLNGYSGYTPPGFDELVPVLNSFPAGKALGLMDDRDVRYVVLRTRLIGQPPPGLGELLRQDGMGRFTVATAKTRIAQIPPERVRRVDRVPGAYVVELRPPRGG